MSTYSLNVIEYLADKIDNKLLNIRNTRTVIQDIRTVDDFRYQKNYLIQNTIDIEDDMKQSSQALRILFKQNQDLIDQIKSLEGELTKYNSKLISDDRYQLELNRRVQELTKENQELRDNDAAMRGEVLRLQQTIREDRRNLSMLSVQDKEKSFTKDSRVEIRDKEREASSISPAPQKKSSFVKSEEEYDEYKDYSSNDGKNKDFKDILDNRHKNKKLLNDVMKDHLTQGDEGYSQVHNRNQDQRLNSRYNQTGNETEINPKQHSRSQENKENKPQKVSDIILKLNSNKDILESIKKIHGNDIFQKLFSADLDVNFLNRVEIDIRILEEQEGGEDNQKTGKDFKLPIKYSSKEEENYKKIKSIIENEIVEEKEENEEDAKAVNKTRRPNSKNPQKIRPLERDISPKSNSTVKKISILSDYSYKPFEQSLRKYSEFESANKRDESRKFCNYTKSYGNYFDQNLQNDGGIYVNSSEANVKNMILGRKSYMSERGLGMPLKAEKSKLSQTKSEFDEKQSKVYNKRDYKDGWKTTKDYFDSDSNDNERNRSSDKIVNKQNI